MSEVTEGDLAAAKIAAAAGGVQAAADIDKVIDIFCAELIDDDRYRRYWPRTLWTDQGFVIADDDQGGLWMFTHTTDADGNVNFNLDDPEKVRETYVTDTSEEPVAARLGKPTVAFASRAEFERHTHQPAASRPENEEDTMDPKEIRERLGLAEDATDEQCFEKLDELKATESTEEPEAEETIEAETKAAETPEPVAASTETTVTVDKEVWEETRRQAGEGAAARTEQLNIDRERVLDTAVKAGKIAPASKDAWREKLVSAPEATKAEIEKLPKGLLPVDGEVGASQAPESAQVDRALSAFGIHRG